LKTYSFNNAEQDDLWEELTKQAHADGNLDNSLSGKTIMDTWTLKMGYPVVEVKRSDDNKLHLTQRWFLLNPLNTIQNTSEYLQTRWYIPFTYTTKEELDFDFEKRPIWFSKDDSESNTLNQRIKAILNHLKALF